MVGKLATTDGSVISSQTVNGTYDSRIIIVPAADHEPGEMAPVYEWIVYGDRMPLVNSVKSRKSSTRTSTLTTHILLEMSTSSL